jgi:hypothetical protein
MKQFVAFTLLLFVSCNTEQPAASQPLFVLRDTASGIFFENSLTYDEGFNTYLYRNFYNGGGVAIGDINNDGLEDVYFTGNMVDNKLFLNKGNWQFEDITAQAKVACPGVWSTGATFADVNGDGWLDLYVCKAGKPEGLNRHNELFINNGDLTFTESSKAYGLDVEGLSVQAAFFDYDKDGDLDVYILNNSLKSIIGFELIKDQRNLPDISGNGNKFFRNDGGKYTDITEEAGIYSSKIGFGLGITLGDFNHDNWTDIYISNDFFEKDYLYLNDTHGKFTESMETYFGSISMGSMGADLADLNNDGLTDLMVTEMLPATPERQKTKTVFESWDKHQLAKQQGYFDQFSRNTLQRNLGEAGFLELGRQAQVSATEWSWGALLFDMDNDGLRDIFISNGIYKDLLDRDYLAYEANEETVKNRINNKERNVITKLIDAMPSQAVPNAAFHNLGDFNFENATEKWGLSFPSFSNGSAYGDLDNDGDLDLVVNNVNMPSFVYENMSDTLNHRSIILKLKQGDGNRDAIGAKASISFQATQYGYGENYVSRGFQSSVPSGIHFGVGSAKTIDTIKVKWPDGATTRLTNLATNSTYTIEHPGIEDPQNSAGGIESTKMSGITKEIEPIFEFEHREDSYIDFNNERLLPQMYSNEGPAFAMADINRDGVQDFFVGGAKKQRGSLFLSTPTGFREITAPFEEAAESEDVDALFFDGDNDGDLDLYVCHGGKAYSPYSIALTDAYYRNDAGVFQKVEDALSFPTPISSSVVKAADFDQDGDQDLFVGERYKTNLYGLPGSGFLMVNDGTGRFKAKAMPALHNIGMITDASWADINNDGQQDLIIVGEWMGVQLLLNQNGAFIDHSREYDLGGTDGLWTSLAVADVDDDGDLDIVAGNIGRNNFFEPHMKMFIGDFDGNGFQEQIICKEVDGKYYPIVDKDELISQIPNLKKTLLFYRDYAKADMRSIFPQIDLDQTVSVNLETTESTIFMNEKGIFKAYALPHEIQYAPVYAINATDIDGDGKTDLFFGGNQYLVKPQFGRYDASMGWAIIGPFAPENHPAKVVPLHIKGQIRDLAWIEYKGKKILIASINNEKTSFHEFKVSF